MAFISESAWVEKIVELEKSSKKSTKSVLKKAIVKAVTYLIPKKKFGILFSGGVDSTLIALICKQADADFICYCVGLKGSPDLVWAKEIAKKYKFKLKTKVFSQEEIEPLFKKTAKMLEHVDILSVGVGSVLVAGIELGKADGITDFFSGLGSEEIFAGYHFHAEADDVHAECWKRLKTMWGRDIRRDSSVAKGLNVNLFAPFIEDSVIKNAMGISADKKIDDENKKIILREIAEDLGLDKKYAWRAKKAAQYGSWFDKCMAKFSRAHGFKAKSEYIEFLKKYVSQ